MFLAKCSRTLYSTSKAGVNWTACDSHTNHDMLSQQQIYITKYTIECFNCNFSEEQCTLHEDDRIIEICGSVLNDLM